MTIPDGTVLGAPIVPGGALPTHYAQYGVGGFFQVADATARDAIPSYQLVAEMQVVLQSDSTVWRWTGSTWASVTTAPAAGSVTNTKLADMAQSTIKGRAASSGTGAPVDLTATQATAILDGMVGDSGSGGTKGLVPAPGSGTAALKKMLRADGTWAQPELTAQNLSQEYESSASTYTSWTLMVATANNGIICFGGATGGKFGKFDWSTFTWTEGACTGATVAAYVWAIYVPGVDLIWAGTTAGSVTHTINPSTMVATDITASSGIIDNAIYNPISGFVYGYVSGSSTIKEMNATTGVVARSFNYATASSGYHAIGVHTTTGTLYLIRKNTGSGPFWIEVPYSAFNAVSQSVACANAPVGVSNYRIAVDPINGRCVWFGGSTIGVAYDIASHTSVDIRGRLTSGGGQVCYDTTNGYFYCLYLGSVFWAARLDGSTTYLASKFVTQLATGSTATQTKHIIYDSVTDRIYVLLTSSGTIIRIIP